MTQIVSVDIGGTHARFALAEVDTGRVVGLGEAVTLKTAEHASFQTAWEEFGRICGAALPRAASIAIAGPVDGELIKLTNNPWIIRPALICEKLAVDHYTVVNDFGAVGHAVAQAGDEHFLHLCGPAVPLPPTGTISIMGPGTGLGVAHVWRDASGYHVQATEGGHVDFAPLDSIEDSILARLRKRHRRVSVERVVAGPAISDIYEALAAMEGRAVQQLDDKTLWELGASGEDSLAAAAIDRFCLSLGSVAGDIALAQGGSSVVIAGGLGWSVPALPSASPPRAVSKA
jgi:glucokinase